MAEKLLLARRDFLKAAALALAGTTMAACTKETSREVRIMIPPPEEEEPIHSSAQALTRLYEGNRRFIARTMMHPNLSKGWRSEIAKEQKPFALIFGCVDSRVPPEVIFDRGLGDLFVIRTAGHVLDNAALASIEFGVEELKIPLVMVLGHKSCGAVKASLEALETKTKLPGALPTLVDGIKPAIDASKGQPGNQVDNVVAIHTDLTIKRLRTSKILSAAEKDGHTKIVGARYDLEKGTIEITSM